MVQQIKQLQKDFKKRETLSGKAVSELKKVGNYIRSKDKFG